MFGGGAKGRRDQGTAIACKTRLHTALARCCSPLSLQCRSRDPPQCFANTHQVKRTPPESPSRRPQPRGWRQRLALRSRPFRTSPRLRKPDLSAPSLTDIALRHLGLQSGLNRSLTHVHTHLSYVCTQDQANFGRYVKPSQRILQNTVELLSARFRRAHQITTNHITSRTHH